MNRRTPSGLITPPYSTTSMEFYRSSPKSDSAISDLCAQTVCFLWFESLPTLHEAATSNFPHHTRVPDIDSFAKQEFVKWTRDVLTTTHVSVNVVILAMLFIYRLKIANPNVKGKAGSEYRLLTVALMLGNKFLDDNTYTNKTWADVTSISVKEIHLMEVEFLSNMRYQLMVTVEEWQQWLIKINMFVCYQQKQQTSKLAMSRLLNFPVSPAQYDAHCPSTGARTYPYQTMPLNPMQVETRGRKRSLVDAHLVEIPNMLPPCKKMLSQPNTPQRAQTSLVTRSGHFGYQNDMSPYQNNYQATLNRTGPRPKISVKQTLSLAPPTAQHQRQHSSTSTNLSPSHLQVGSYLSTGSSPTLSSISQYSCHSHGPALGYSPTSLAMKHRSSPYAPIQPVQTLVGKYQPIFHYPQMGVPGKESLWYSQLAAGAQQPIYNGQVPLYPYDSAYEEFSY